MIEIGEYVRTKNGKIRKVKSTVAQYYITDRLNISDNNQFEKEDIVKHSKNIIDLVESGDYVNGKLIHKIDKGQNYCYLYYGNCKTFVDYQIKTILTKEQYMQNCYTIERKE